MSTKEIEIPSQMQNYREWPSLIGQENCPRCNSLNIKIIFTNFQREKMAWDVICLDCSFYYKAKFVPDKMKIIIVY